MELLVVLVVLGVLLAVVGVAGVVTTTPTSSHLGIRIRAVGNRTDITEVDSTVAVSSLTRAASTGLVIRDSAGVLVLGERR